jgi:uncharacterized OB-fold protein
MAESRIPGPNLLPDNLQFWSAASAGQLLVPHCNDCGQHHWYPRQHCPFCHSNNLTLERVSGRGRVYSFSVMRKAEGGAYVIAYVKLEQDVTLLTNIVNADVDSIHIDQEVRVVFVASATGQAVPMFEPCPPDGGRTQVEPAETRDAK